MFFRFPKDDARTSWTRHIKNKMLFYGLSEARIRGVLQSPDRREEGIAPGTTAAMQRSKMKKKPEEIWVMYCSLREPRIHADKTLKNAEDKKIPRQSASRLRTSANRMLMISAWRYPGVTKPGRRIPVPEDIGEAIAEIGLTNE